ncbi:MAG: hypothetical protein EOP84_02900 [Verrucomicrobiaceae bacterium]|nr:MAG: hypothetical protein EOP84_02900 [Verrucomicrobiaceae bacterium]
MNSMPAHSGSFGAEMVAVFILIFVWTFIEWLASATIGDPILVKLYRRARDYLKLAILERNIAKSTLMHIYGGQASLSRRLQRDDLYRSSAIPEEIIEWLDSFVGHYGRVPGKEPLLWFRNPNDAMAFRMRWA